jgi:hypothetical protein
MGMHPPFFAGFPGGFPMMPFPGMQMAGFDQYAAMNNMNLSNGMFPPGVMNMDYNNNREGQGMTGMGNLRGQGAGNGGTMPPQNNNNNNMMQQGGFNQIQRSFMSQDQVHHDNSNQVNSMVVDGVGHPGPSHDPSTFQGEESNMIGQS